MATVALVDPALARLAPRFVERLPADVTVDAVADFSRDELARVATNAVVFVNARRPIDAATLAAAPHLRLVQAIGVGVDSVDQAALTAAGVALAFNPGVNRTGAAEQTIMLMLALIKRLPASEEITRAGRFAPADVIAQGIDDLADATVGIVGLGQIGEAVAERLGPFGPTLLYHARRDHPDVEARLGLRRLPLAELLRASNIVTLHVPLTAETRHLIGPAELAAMPRGSWLVNAGRGELVEEAALRSAVLDGHLAGAALDVVEREPEGRNPFADVPGILVTPHVGGGSRNSMNAVVERCTANIRRLLDGEPLRDQVLPERAGAIAS